MRGYGKLVIIKHNDTYLSAYAHNSSVLEGGQSVAKGRRSPRSAIPTRPRFKLHFEIRRQGEPVDPLKFLPERRS